MSVYDVNALPLAEVCSALGVNLAQAYDISGNIVFSSWRDEITVEKKRDASTSTAYYVVTIPQVRRDGSKQYPFVYVPNGANGGTQSTLQMMRSTPFYMGMNGGYFDAFQTGSKKPYGFTIQNGVLVRSDTSYFTTNYTLTIDENGTLGYAGTAASGVTAQDILDSGVVSALLGLVPLVIDGQPSTVESSIWTSTERAQRQIIGQYPNGDYCIVTCEGRNFDSSPGFLVSEVRSLCADMGLYFAMAVDGGGSTETVIGDEQINTIYEGTYGRVVPTYIVFNGTDEFFVPYEVTS